MVKSINYKAQTVKVNDPEGCFPMRFLHNNLSLSLHPLFTFDATIYNLTFLRCPSNITDSIPFPQISCLSESNSNSSLLIFSWWLLSDMSLWCDECEVILLGFVSSLNPKTMSFFLLDLKTMILSWSGTSPRVRNVLMVARFVASPETRVYRLDASSLLQIKAMVCHSFHSQFSSL